MEQTTEKQDSLFVDVAKSVDGSQHFLGIDFNGYVWTWGRNNEMGQLGRDTNSRTDCKTPTLAKFQQPQQLSSSSSSTLSKDNDVTAQKVFAGGSSESGHSAIIDQNGILWVTGCDRWQQLGLGSSHGGSSGYTWEFGKIWRTEFVRNEYLHNFLNDLYHHQNQNQNHQKKNFKTTTNEHSTTYQQSSSSSSFHIRDVALGGDHTVILLSNQRDVITFGKGGDGQLGLVRKPFVSAPVKSTILSSSSLSSSSSTSTPSSTSSTSSTTTTEAVQEISAVCAIQHCSLTLDVNGNILKHAGRCRGLFPKEERDNNNNNNNTKQTTTMAVALKACIERAKRQGLISS